MARKWYACFSVRSKKIDIFCHVLNPFSVISGDVYWTKMEQPISSYQYSTILSKHLPSDWNRIVRWGLYDDRFSPVSYTQFSANSVSWQHVAYPLTWRSKVNWLILWHVCKINDVHIQKFNHSYLTSFVTYQQTFWHLLFRDDTMWKVVMFFDTHFIQDILGVKKGPCYLYLFAFLMHVKSEHLIHVSIHLSYYWFRRTVMLTGILSLPY
jgi:hypothetical protein